MMRLFESDLHHGIRDHRQSRGFATRGRGLTTAIPSESRDLERPAARLPVQPQYRCLRNWNGGLNLVDDNTEIVVSDGLPDGVR